jgi:hypothetical protein
MGFNLVTNADDEEILPRHSEVGCTSGFAGCPGVPKVSPLFENQGMRAGFMGIERD